MAGAVNANSSRIDRMLGRSNIVAFVGTAEPQRARGFYGEVLGLRLTADTPFALVFDAHGTTLRVAKVETVVAAPYTVLGWTVPDIFEAVGTLTAAGVAFERFESLPQDGLGVWSTPDGGKVAWFKDPDGNLLSLAQPPAGGRGSA